MSFLMGLFLSLWQGLSSLFPFFILLGVLVFIHELGHFIVARWCKVRVEVFSLGFGKKILKWKKGDTLYCISLLPLGGYVKMFMFGHEYNQEISEKDKAVAFVYKKLWQRTLIVLAGPMMNFFLAILLFAGLSMVFGEKKIKPLVGEVASSSVASKAGFQYGDQILSVNGQVVTSVQEAEAVIFQNSHKMLDIKVKDSAGKIQTKKVLSDVGEGTSKWGFLEKGGVVEGLSFSAPASIIGMVDPLSPAGQLGLKTFDKIVSVNGTQIKTRKDFLNSLNLSSLPWEIQVQREREPALIKVTMDKQNLSSKQVASKGLLKEGLAKEDLAKVLGFYPHDLFIAGVQKKGAADRAGLKKGDFIFKVNGERVVNWSNFVSKVQGFKPEQGSLKVEVKREGKVQSVALQPEIKKRLVHGIEQVDYMVGIFIQSPSFFVGESYVEKEKNLFKALGTGVGDTFHYCGMMGVFIKKLITGDISKKTLGGPIAIGRAAYNSYSYGLEYFFKIMAILSVQLFVLNMLPIPILDGGHLFFYLIEFFNKAPLSMKKMMVVQQIGFVFILFLLLFTTFNDLHNWFFLW